MWASIKETFKTVVYALLIAGVFRTFLFQPFWIPSGSMKETLLIGDFLFVNKMAYGYSYASCPSIVIPRFGINVDAEDFCGVFKDSDDRLFGSDPERGDVV
ncbi:MAG: signal peptidase I, partial [Octadecabacter sp.]